MRKWLMVLFLLLITSISIVGYMNTLHSDGTEIEIDSPGNIEIIR